MAEAPDAAAGTRRAGQASFVTLAAQLFATYGYLVVAGAVGLESVGLPLPGETILI